MVPPFSLGGSQSILSGLRVLQQAEFRHCVGPSGFSHLQATFGQTSYKVALRFQALGLDRSCWGKDGSCSSLKLCTVIRMGRRQAMATLFQAGEHGDHVAGPRRCS